MTRPTDAVFFISFGGPEKPEEVRPFLEIVTRGRRIPPERIEEVAHHYEVIGGASPINAITNRQANALRKLLRESPHPAPSPLGRGNLNNKPPLLWGDRRLHNFSKRAGPAGRRREGGGEGLPVYVGNRNWHPFIEETLRKMLQDGIKHAVGFPTAAHRTEASWERYLNAVEAAREKIGPDAPEIHYVAPWFDHPLFIEAICKRIKESKNAAGEPFWIFTAHSIPTAMARASRYVQELSKTAELVAAKFGVEQWTLAYTSRSGAPTDPWLEPDVCDEIRAQALRGVREILAVPIGFVADHVEVLFDLDVEAKEAARQAGVTLRRAQTVGDHPLFIQMIADVVRKAAIPAE